jgi:tetratricopeptide (TPR) repeat protein
VIAILIVGAFLGGVEHDEAARYFKMRAYAEAERRYAVLAATNSGDLAAALGVADAIAKQEDGQRAAASYQLFVDGVFARPKPEGAKWAKDVARASNAIGVVATDLGRWDDAEKAFLRASSLAPKEELFRTNLAFAVRLNPKSNKGGPPTLPRGVTLCKSRGEPKTAGLPVSIWLGIERERPDFAKRIVAADSPFRVVVCERDAIEIDVFVSLGVDRRSAVFASARSWSEIVRAIASVVDRAVAVEKQRN